MKDYKNFKFRFIAEIVDFFGSILFLGIRKKEINPDSIQKILIIKLDRIGDTFLATPTIEAIRKKFSKSKIIALVAPWNKSILENNPNIDELKIFEKALNVHESVFFNLINHFKIDQLVKLIKDINPDMAIDLEGHPLNVLAAFKAKVPIRVGFGEKILSFLLTNKTKRNNEIYQADIYFEIAKVLKCDKNRDLPKIYNTDEEIKKVKEFIKENNLDNFIVIHLGAGRTYRQWPIDNFIKLGNELLENYKLKIVLIGGGEDEKLGIQFLNNIKKKNDIINAINFLNIPETYYLVSKAKLFIGSESAPMHLSGVQNIPTIAFMNEWSGIERWKPLGEKVYVFQSKNIHHCPGVSCHLNPCPNMAAISVKEVYNFIKNKILYENSSSK